MVYRNSSGFWRGTPLASWSCDGLPESWSFSAPSLSPLACSPAPVAFLLSGQMAFAYFFSHFPRGFWPVLNGGERAPLFCFIFLLLVATGPGRLALDNVFFGKGEKDAK